MSHTDKSTQRAYGAAAHVSPSLSRRALVASALAAASSAVLFGLPARAHAARATQATIDALATAEEKLAAVEAELDKLAADFEALSHEQDRTVSQIEEVQAQLDETQAQIDEKQAELENKQGVLSRRVSNSYKDGGTSMLTLLMAADSFDDLLSNSHYIEKVNDADKQVIGEIQAIRAELEQHKSTLESQKADLEALKEQQAQQLSVMQAKQAEVQQLVDGLSSDVRTSSPSAMPNTSPPLRKRSARRPSRTSSSRVPAAPTFPARVTSRDRSSPWNASSPHAAPSRAPATACAPCGSPVFSLPPALAMWAATRTTCITATARAPTAAP